MITIYIHEPCLLPMNITICIHDSGCTPFLGEIFGGSSYWKRDENVVILGAKNWKGRPLGGVIHHEKWWISLE